MHLHPSTNKLGASRSTVSTDHMVSANKLLSNDRIGDGWEAAGEASHASLFPVGISVFAEILGSRIWNHSQGSFQIDIFRYLRHLLRVTRLDQRSLGGMPLAAKGLCHHDRYLDTECQSGPA